MAERDAAIHAAGPLGLERFDRQRIIDFQIIVQPIENFTPFWGLAWQFHESGWLAHDD
jgi:hypothetical protein